jgi:hypothetical protein
LHGDKVSTAEFRQDVFLGREVVKKGSFSYIGCFGDVFYRGAQKATLGEKIQRGAIETIARFRAVALAAAGGSARDFVQ